MTQNQKILIVDDEVDTISIVADYLAKKGFEISVAQDAAQGIKLSIEITPDLILLDIALPDLNGFDFLEEIKKRKIETRVILISAYYNTDDDIIKGIKAGACDFITKPLEPVKVLNKVKRALISDATINTQVSDPAPIIKELLANVERLKAETRVAQVKADLLEKKTLTRRWFLRLLSLVTAALTVSLLFIFGILKDPIVAAVTVILLALFLALPIDRAYEFTSKIIGFQTRIRMSDENSREESLRQKNAFSQLAHEFFTISSVIESELVTLEQNPLSADELIPRMRRQIDISREKIRLLMKSND